MTGKRRRVSAVAAVALAAVVFGGLTACSDEDSGDTGQSAAEEPAADAGDASESASPEEDAPAADAEADEGGESGGLHAAGEAVSYAGGVDITVSAPEEYTPSEYAIGHTEGNTAWKVTITVVNNGDADYDTDFLLASARAGDDGVTAETIYDDPVGLGFGGALPAGQTATADFAFDAPADAATLSVQIEEVLELDSAPATWGLEL
ncbi:DUF4352 domain-containing protein [Streptomyces hoynatensis]|uniref:DUF4352 domain-containing protein n=1 Tax=Streptomyces hoynatensis TaxID=1141874 RepID=UPI001319CBAA|nr:DUF4352 domain-containing protein [Streptomyces hoynatensis]